MNLKELSWKERGRLWMRLGIRLFLTIVVILLFALLWSRFLSLFMPFVLALIVALILNPLVRWIHRYLHVSRKLTSLLIILLVFALAGGVLFLFFYQIGTEVYSLITEWANMGGDIESSIDALGNQMTHLANLLPDQVVIWVEALVTEAVTWLQGSMSELLSIVGKAAGGFAMKLPSGVVATVVFLMASYFMIADYPHIRDSFVNRMGNGTRDFFGHVRDVAVSAFGGYFKAQFILSCGVFLILLIGYVIIGQSYALLLAFVLAIVDFIPLIGAGTAMVPWAVVCVLLGDYRKAIELMVIWGVICLFRRLAEPKVVGDQTGLSPILSLISIYVGMQLGGIVGMILGPVLVLVFINLRKTDVCSGLRQDLKLGVMDIRAILSHKRT